MRKLCVIALFAFITSALLAQQTAIPNFIHYGGVLKAGHGSMTGVTFLLYRDEQGGAPLWMETQNVALDAAGRYSVHLGAASNGLPADLFQSGEARWLAVQPAGEAEQPRVLLVAVPYAMKAADSQTLGGLPPSAFVLAAPPAATANSASTAGTSPNTLSPSLSGTGATDFLPLWTSTTALGSSALFQTGSGSSAKIGINTTTPAAMLDVKGSVTIRALLNLPATATANASAGADSNQIGFVASTFNSSTNVAANQVFRLQAEPVGNDTSSPSASLNLLFGTAPTVPAETGLRISSKGQITFASGQTFPGTGPGTITGITAGTDLTGGGTAGAVMLNLDTTKVPQLAAANTFTGNQTVNGNLSATGIVSGNSFEIGSLLFGFGNYNNGNAFVGFAGNSSSTGTNNTAVGVLALGAINSSGTENTAVGNGALFSDTSGGSNTAIGFRALLFNNTGGLNTAVGSQAMNVNTDGGDDTATGAGALAANTLGSNNTADGAQALGSNTTGNYNTASGYSALFHNINGASNTTSGFEAGINNTTGSNNTGFGAGAVGSTSTGSNNTGVGVGALSGSQTASNNTCIGYQCTASNNASNATAVGAHAVAGASNTLVLGGTGEFAVKVGIGTATPTNIFTIAQGAGHPVSDSWETYSSRRWKTNIQTLPNALGKVEKLRGVSYDMKDSGKHEIGVIAEEVGAVVPELVSYEANGKDARSVDYSRLSALLIEAMKQQQKEIQQLKSELRRTRQTLQQVKTQVQASQTVSLAKK
jgi:hypothetical protein